jgi:CubicO group peptidase (beta-lactamase class C family)
MTLAMATPGSLRLDERQLERLCAAVERDIAAGHHPGAQVAVARDGHLALDRSFGQARAGLAAGPQTLWLLYSNTKVVTAAALWTLVEEGLLSFDDTVARHLPGFGTEGKEAVTVRHLLTHQAGFPGAGVPPSVWRDHALLLPAVCDFALEWEPGSRVQYHPAAAHWVAAALIEALTGEDYRDAIRKRVIRPLGLEEELFVGLPEAEHGRAAAMHAPDGTPLGPECSAEHRLAGIPGGGGYATARALAEFYQVLAHGGALPGGKRLVSPRVMAAVLRDHTGDRVDGFMGLPMHRGLGPHLRGEDERSWGLGSLAHPKTFGHGGAGSSYAWADPVSRVSFAFISNARQTEAFHVARMERLSNLVHAAILDD